MPHPFEYLALFAALVVLTVIAPISLAIDAGDELSEPQARVLCAAMKVVEHVAIADGTVLAPRTRRSRWS